MNGDGPRETRGVELGEELDTNVYVNDSVQLLRRIFSTVFGNFEIGQVIRALKYANGLVLLTKRDTVLQDMIDKLIEIRSFYGMEVNVENTKAMRISVQPPTIQIMVD